MKLKPYYCIVSPVKITTEGSKLVIERDETIIIAMAKSEADATECALRRYKSYPDKFKYDEILVFAREFRPQMILSLLDGELLELAKQKLEVFDALDADVIC